MNDAASNGEADQETRMSWIWRCVFMPKTNIIFLDGVKWAVGFVSPQENAPTFADRRISYEMISMT